MAADPRTEVERAMEHLRAAGLRIVGLGSEDPPAGEQRTVHLELAAREPGGDVLELARWLGGGLFQ